MNEDQNANSMQPQQAPTPPQPQGEAMGQPAPQQNTEGLVYAGFGVRFVALLIDSLILGTVNFVLGMLGGVLGDEMTTIFSLLGTLIGWGYLVYMDVNMGATIGKKALNLRVQHVETGQNLNYVEAFLREVVGKFISGIVLGLGYIWVLFDAKKQGWHDKIASSVVVKVSQ